MSVDNFYKLWYSLSPCTILCCTRCLIKVDFSLRARRYAGVVGIFLGRTKRPMQSPTQLLARSFPGIGERNMLESCFSFTFWNHYYYFIIQHNGEKKCLSFWPAHCVMRDTASNCSIERFRPTDDLVPFHLFWAQDLSTIMEGQLSIAPFFRGKHSGTWHEDSLTWESREGKSGWDRRLHRWNIYQGRSA